MTAIQDYMKAEHRDCDHQLIAFESAVVSHDWEIAGERWNRFEESLLHHFEIEEQLLFPKIEEHTGMTEGPTAVMRLDHEQMRVLLPSIRQGLTDRDESRLLGMVQSMLVLVQQHNMKEEGVLYPMADNAIPDAGSLAEEMRSATSEG